MDGDRTFDLAQLCAENPLRPADWRFQLAVWYGSRGRVLPRRELDPLTISLCYGLRRRGQTADRMLGNALWDAASRILGMALDIFLDEDPLLRYALEARVLADIPVPRIAAKIGVISHVIYVYEGAFFDVRGRLSRSDFILTRVIAPRVEDDVDWRDGAWKVFAYLGGSETLESMMGKRVEGLEYFGVKQREAIRNALQYRLQLVASQEGVLDAAVLRTLARFVADGGKEEDEITDYSRNVEQMLMGIPLEILDRMDAEAMYRDQGCAELRNSDRMLLANGFEVPGLEEKKAFQWRPPGRDPDRIRYTPDLANQDDPAELDPDSEDELEEIQDSNIHQMPASVDEPDPKDVPQEQPDDQFS